MLCVVVAMALRGAVVVTHQPDKKPWSDSAHYVNLGSSLADGKGYVLQEGNMWPGKPTIVRAPGWPIVLSGVFRIIPASWRWEVAAGLAIVLDGLNVVLLYLLARGIGGGRRAAGAASFLYAVSPVMAAMCMLVASEVLAILLVLIFLNYFVRIPGLTGTSQLMPGNPAPFKQTFIAGIWLGLASLVRPNFLLIGFVAAAGLIWIGRTRIKISFVLAVVLLFATLIPLTPWLIRNTLVFRSFPVLGAGGGETLFGGNNDMAAQRGGKYEGYIVQPGGIPGEKSVFELAVTMNEAEVDRYYTKKALTWITSNMTSLPHLVMMKLKRAYVPISPSGSWDVRLANLYRGLVDLLALGGIVYFVGRGGRLTQMVVLGLGAMFVSHIILISVFCGPNRYSLPSEILLVIPAGSMIVALGSFKKNTNLVLKRLVLWSIHNKTIWAMLDRSVMRIARFADWKKTPREPVYIDAGLVSLSEEISPDLVVRNGVFKGMRYPERKSLGSAMVPKLLGSYERELQSVLDRIVATKYSTIVDVGCAEGYYAVGLAMRIPSAIVYAYDSNKEATQVCAEMARLNHVSDRVVIGEFCDSVTLELLAYKGKSLIVSDCEGYEKLLFTPNGVAHLADHDFLIEIHDFIDISISGYIRDLFEKTHHIEVIESIDDMKKARLYHFAEIEKYDLATRRRIMAEGRPVIMEWFFMQPRL